LRCTAGYHSDAISNDKAVTDLRSLEMIRERSLMIYKLAEEGKTRHFRINKAKLDEAAAYVMNETKKNYPDGKVPYHSRWRHFPTPTIEALVKVHNPAHGSHSCTRCTSSSLCSPPRWHTAGLAVR
jgi:hypothetical protein